MKRLRDDANEEVSSPLQQEAESVSAVGCVSSASGIAESGVEKQLLADLVLARDALDKMKQLLSSRIRHDAAAGEQARLRAESEALHAENRRLRKALAAARNREAQTRRVLARLERVLQERGLSAELAAEVAAQTRAPPRLVLALEAPATTGQIPVPEEHEIAKNVRIKPCPTLTLSGEDAIGDEFSIVCRASVNGRVVEDVLGGDFMLPVELVDGVGCVVFENLTFKQTSNSASSGLPFDLVFVVAERGILEPLVAVRYPVSFLCVANKKKS